MSDALTIKLSVQGVQQAVASFQQVKENINGIGKSVGVISKLGVASAVLGEIASGFEGAKSTAKLAQSVFHSVKESIASMSATPLEGIAKAAKNWWYLEENALKSQLQLEEKILEVKQKNALLKNSFDQIKSSKDTVPDEIKSKYEELTQRQRDMAALDVQALSMRLPDLKKKLKEAVDWESVDAIKARIQIQQIEHEISMQEVELQGQLNQLKTEMLEKIDSAALEQLRKRLDLEESVLKLKQDQFKIDREAISASFRITDAQKQKKTKASLDAENKMLQGELQSLRAEYAAAGVIGEVTAGGKKTQMFFPDVNKRDMIQAQIDQTQHRLNQNEQERTAANSAPDLESYRDQFLVTINNIRREIGTTAQQVAGVFGSTIQGAISGIAGSIQGLIQGTMRWKDALSNIGSTILSSVIQAISQMIAKLLIIKALSIFIPGGGLFTKLFAQGGYTGDGPTNEPAGIVHKGEYVIPALQVRQIGLENINSLLNGMVPRSAASFVMPERRESQTVQNLAFFDDGTRLHEWARTQEGETVIVDVVRRNMHRIV